jgi:hypothetical protein
MMKNMSTVKSSCYLLCVCLLLQFSAQSQEDWVLKKDKDGIKVFSKKKEQFKLNEIKVESTFDGRISQLAAVLLDVNNHKNWVYRTAATQLLKMLSPSSLLYYSETSCPWPFDNRDLVVQLAITQNAENKVMMIDVKNIEGYLPEKNDIVRLKYLRTNWTVTPLPNNQFKVDYQIQVDPGINVPAWLLNIFTINGPYDTFVNLKKEIKLPQYVNAKFPFLAD